MLPDYIAIDFDEIGKLEIPSQPSVLRTPAAPIQFPLAGEDALQVSQLLAKFKQEENCAGLAAPQIGYGKRAIVYHVPEGFKSFRKEVLDAIPPTVLINPEYQPIGDEKVIDWEGCFSVKGTMAEVPRYREISYQGYDPSGNRVEGTAKGFLARLLQHEIGHLNGELFTDLVTEECRIGPVEEMRALRIKEFEAAKQAREAAAQAASSEVASQ